jgi:hypothetical protein
MTPPQAAPTIGKGTPEFAAKLLTDLYVRLRRDLQQWASVTHQTPQPRMGYVGQHLVSVVTGYPGGRSGARGDDLKLPDGGVAEIKCCYRVDQLGQCRRCRTAVASIEKVCPNSGCGSTDLERKDDSKWLLSPKSEQELRELFVPVRYYLVLFEFADISKADDIDVQIFEVDPRCLGFALCVIDYYFNIRTYSPSKAAFDLWPDMAKFRLMRPRLIYWSVINGDDTIDTKLFPGTNSAQLCAIRKFPDYARATTISEAVVDQLALLKGVTFAAQAVAAGGAAPRRGKRGKLEALQVRREAEQWDDEALADDLARIVYRDKVAGFKPWTDEFAPTL